MSIFKDIPKEIKATLLVVFSVVSGIAIIKSLPSSEPVANQTIENGIQAITNIFTWYNILGIVGIIGFLVALIYLFRDEIFGKGRE